jgi:hypothetical protein
MIAPSPPSLNRVNVTLHGSNKLKGSEETRRYIYQHRFYWYKEEKQWTLFVHKTKIKSLHIVIKHVFICNNPYIYTTVVQEVYNQEVDDVEGLAVSATKHLELLQQKYRAECSFNIEKRVGKLLSRTLDLFHFIYPLQDYNGWKFNLHSDPEETIPFKLSPKMENLTNIVYPYRDIVYHYTKTSYSQI